MTTNPSDETPAGGTPPPPPPGAGYGDQVPPAGAQTPPPGGYQAPPGGYQAPPAGGYVSSGPAAPLSDSDQRMWATLSHIGGVFLSFVAPLIVWLIHKERGRFVEEQSKEALNFQILIAILYVASSVLSFIGIGLLLIPLVWLASLVFGIIAAVAANKGEPYRYPLNWRIVK